MNRKIEWVHLGQMEYKEAWEAQEKRFDGILELKVHNRNGVEKQPTPNYLLIVEHPHVYTLGKSGDEHNLLLNHIQLQAKDATFYHTNRGGDITYHGPGQIVGYPILDLENFEMGLREYIEKMEQVIIRTIADYGLVGERLEGATGVWLDPDDSYKARKICAIGVKSSRFVTMHGFALNVNTDLDYFGYINPCGFTDKQVTSLEKELGRQVPLCEVEEKICTYFEEIYQGTIVKE